MLALDAIQTALVADDNKTARWAITIFDTAGTGYGYYTDAVGADGWAVDTAWETGTAWFSGISNDVVIMDFDGIELRRNSSEAGIIAPSDLTFSMSNPDNTYAFTLFKGGTVFVELFLWNPTYGERKIQGWKFNIKSCEPGYQKLKFTCQDFLQQYLRGDYPNTRIPEDVFKSSRDYARENVCIPVPFGTAYVPLRDVYIEDAITLTASDIASVAAATSNRAKITGTGLSAFKLGTQITIAGFTTTANNGTFSPLKISATEIEFDTTAFVDESAGDSVTLTQNRPFFMLGDTTNTYTITKLRAPKEYGGSEYPGATEARALSVVFPQTTLADSDGTNWRLFEALTADDDKDGVNENPGGYSNQGGITRDPIVQFTRSDTASITNPADVIAFVLKDMGIPAAYIDEAGTFASCHATFDGYAQPLVFNGAFWYKQPREKVLAQLLTACHSCLDVGETIQLRVLSATQQGADITSADVLRSSEQGEGSFTYRDIVNEDYTDSVHVAWRDNALDGTPKPQDTFLKCIVACDAVANVIPKELLQCPFVQDSQNIQRIGKLYGQRKFGKVATVGWLNKSSRLAHQPDDVLDINEANYGGNYFVLIDSMKINKDVSIQFNCTKFSYTLENWADITPAVLSIPVDDTANTWQPTISGPQTDQDIGRSAYTVWGQEWLKVGPIANQGQYTDIQQALNAVKQAGGGAIYILNGSYQAPGPLYVPDVNLEVVGQSQGGVVLKNLAGSDLWVLHNLTKTFKFGGFSIESQNAAVFSNMFNLSGTTAADNTCIASLSAIDITLTDDGVAYSGGDNGVYGGQILADVAVTSCRITNGGKAISLPAATARITKNYITGSKNYAVGMALSGPEVSEVCDNRIEDNYSFGIYTAKTNNLVMNGNYIKARTSSGIRTTWTGILFGGSRTHISGNTVICENSGVTSGFAGISCSWSDANYNNCHINGNTIKAIVDTYNRCNTEAMYLPGLTDSEIISNVINVDITKTAFMPLYETIGIKLGNATFSLFSLRNVISGNSINLTDETNAGTIGIKVIASCNDNRGSNNLFYNCGTKISDSGTGNLINKSGGGTF